jgi:hypothetical protein
LAVWVSAVFGGNVMSTPCPSSRTLPIQARAPGERCGVRDRRWSCAHHTRSCNLGSSPGRTRAFARRRHRCRPRGDTCRPPANIAAAYSVESNVGA